MKAGEFCYAYHPVGNPPDDVRYHGNCATVAGALAEAINDIRIERLHDDPQDPHDEIRDPQTILIAAIRLPRPPEDLIDADDVFECVSADDDYTGDNVCLPWDGLDRRDSRYEELTAALSKTVAAWMDKHDMRPTHFMIEEDVKEFTEAEAAAMLENPPT